MGIGIWHLALWHYNIIDLALWISRFLAADSQQQTVKQQTSNSKYLAAESQQHTVKQQTANSKYLVADSQQQTLSIRQQIANI